MCIFRDRDPPSRWDRVPSSLHETSGLLYRMKNGNRGIFGQELCCGRSILFNKNAGLFPGIICMGRVRVIRVRDRV